jgi:hypothetical protein
MSLTVVVPVRTVSVPNQRGHWSKHSPLTKEQKFWARTLVEREKEKPPLPVRVTMIRCSPGRIKDSDNLGTALKAVRDGIAAAYEADDQDLDGNPQFVWAVGQEKADEYSVRITIEPA